LPKNQGPYPNPLQRRRLKNLNSPSISTDKAIAFLEPSFRRASLSLGEGWGWDKKIAGKRSINTSFTG